MLKAMGSLSTRIRVQDRDLKLPERLLYEDGAELVKIELLPEDPGYRENH